MPRSSQSKIAILGAGPIGLEAALYARHLDYLVEIYEAGRVGEYLQRWGHVRLFSPFGMNITPLGRQAIHEANSRHEFPGDNDCITGKEHLGCYLEPLAKCELLKECLNTETRVVGIGRRGFLKGQGIGDGTRAKQPFRLLLRDNKNQERSVEADIVLDCTGTYGQHRWLGSGGIPAVGELVAEKHICYTLENYLGERRNHYAGKTIIVVGGGYSAATTVSQLAELAQSNADTWVIWLAQNSNSQPLHRFPNDPLKERDRLALRANMLATRRNEGNVEFYPGTSIEVIEGNPDQGFKVTARCGGEMRTWNAERIIGNVGYTPNRDLYRELQVHECYASLGPMKLAATLLGQGGDCLKQMSGGADTLRNPEPGFFILGSKSYGRNSHFLLRQGFEQVREVFTLITGKASLNLYKDN